MYKSVCEMWHTQSWFVLSLQAFHVYNVSLHVAVSQGLDSSHFSILFPSRTQMHAFGHRYNCISSSTRPWSVDTPARTCLLSMFILTNHPPVSSSSFPIKSFALAGVRSYLLQILTALSSYLHYLWIVHFPNLITLVWTDRKKWN